jgi:hypothetical protein
LAWPVAGRACPSLTTTFGGKSIRRLREVIMFVPGRGGTACIFWLKNRMPKDWRDVRDHVVEHQNLDKFRSPCMGSCCQA